MFIYVAIKKMNTSRRLMFRFVPFVFINDLRYLFLRTRTEITNERIFGDTKETSVGLEKKKKKKKYRRDFSFRKKRKKKKRRGKKERKKRTICSILRWDVIIPWTVWKNAIQMECDIRWECLGRRWREEKYKIRPYINIDLLGWRKSLWEPQLSSPITKRPLNTVKQLMIND